MMAGYQKGKQDVKKDQARGDAAGGTVFNKSNYKKKREFEEELKDGRRNKRDKSMGKQNSSRSKLLLLWLTMLSLSIQAQESVENYNRFVLPTVKLSDGDL